MQRRSIRATTRNRAATLAILVDLWTVPGDAQPPPMQVGFLWHMHQPIYDLGESILQTTSAGRFSFSVVDVHNQRLGPYTTWPKDARAEQGERVLPLSAAQRAVRRSAHRSDTDDRGGSGGPIRG